MSLGTSVLNVRAKCIVERKRIMCEIKGRSDGQAGALRAAGGRMWGV